MQGPAVANGQNPPDADDRTTDHADESGKHDYEVRDVALSEPESQGPHEQEVSRFVESLSNEERMLVVLKSELYDGSWDEMQADLKARLEGRPYIFKLAHRITDDLERISKLREFERKYDIDLSEYVDL